MTDKEILKALECCTPTNESCLNCPLIDFSVPECAEILYKETLALINRQQAEVERLERHTEMYHEVRAEAIKEFAERLKWELAHIVTNVTDMREVVDNLVKEMVGEDK